MSLLYRCMGARQFIHNITLNCIRPSTQIRMSSTNPSKPDQDDTKFIVKFKQTDVKEVFKKFYSLYGPLFIGCHIGVSLISLGFFSTLVWLSIDPTKFIPEYMIEKVGERVASLTSDGGKFMVAYAIHKVILPARLGAAIYLTKVLSQKLKPGKK